MKPSIRDSLDRYAREHTPTGSFLRAVLENDLHAALFKADDDNRAALMNIVRYVYNDLPRACWGSPEKVKAWLAQKPERVS